MNKHAKAGLIAGGLTYMALSYLKGLSTFLSIIVLIAFSYIMYDMFYKVEELDRSLYDYQVIDISPQGIMDNGQLFSNRLTFNVKTEFLNNSQLFTKRIHYVLRVKDCKFICRYIGTPISKTVIQSVAPGYTSLINQNITVQNLPIDNMEGVTVEFEITKVIADSDREI